MDAHHPARELLRLINGFQVSQALHVAATLGIADLIGDGSETSDDLAAKTNAHPRSLYRVLRALGAAGVLHEEEGRRFRLTPVGACLRSDAPKPLGPWAAMIGRPTYWGAWGALGHSVRTGENAFKHVHGADVWEYRSARPDEGAAFDAGMVAISTGIAEAVARSYDFSQYGRVVDVGGGRGGLLAGILAAHPPVAGVLFDQPQVVAGARNVLEAAGVLDRCELVGGSFFEEVPGGGDLYVLKAILHDWEDEDCLRILRACRRAVPAHAKLLVVERLLGPPNKGLEVKIADVNMLVSPGGQERTEGEYDDLLRAGGFELRRIVPTGTVWSLIEAVPLPA